MFFLKITLMACDRTTVFNLNTTASGQAIVHTFHLFIVSR